MGMKFYTRAPDYPDEVTFTLDQGTEHASYVLDNLLSRKKTKQFRTANGSATDVYIEFDFGTTITANRLIIDGSFSTTDDLQVHTDVADNGAGWGELVLDSAQVASEAITVYSFTSKTRRYWRLRCSVMAANAVDWINNAFICTEYETPYNPHPNFNNYWDYGNIKEIGNNDYTQRYKSGKRKRVWANIQILNFTDANRLLWESQFDDNCQGLLRPFYAVDADLSTVRFWAFSGEPRFTVINNDNSTLRTGLIEEV